MDLNHQKPTDQVINPEILIFSLGCHPNLLFSIILQFKNKRLQFIHCSVHKDFIVSTKHGERKEGK